MSGGWLHTPARCTTPDQTHAPTAFRAAHTPTAALAGAAQRRRVAPAAEPRGVRSAAPGAHRAALQQPPGRRASLRRPCRWLLRRCCSNACLPACLPKSMGDGRSQLACLLALPSPPHRQSHLQHQPGCVPSPLPVPTSRRRSAAAAACCRRSARAPLCAAAAACRSSPLRPSTSRVRGSCVRQRGWWVCGVRSRVMARGGCGDEDLEASRGPVALLHSRCLPR